MVGSTVTAASGSGAVVQFGQGQTTVQAASYGAGTEFDLLAGHGGGIDIINGFRVGIDHLHMGAGISIVSTSAARGNTVLRFNDNSQVQLAGVSRPSAGQR